MQKSVASLLYLELFLVVCTTIVTLQKEGTDRTCLSVSVWVYLG